jgi:hypothetical protein
VPAARACPFGQPTLPEWLHTCRCRPGLVGTYARTLARHRVRAVIRRRLVRRDDPDTERGDGPAQTSQDRGPAGLPRGPSILRPADATGLQRLAGNRATTTLIQAWRPHRPAVPAALPLTVAVQRLDIYGRAAAEASPLPAAPAAAFQRQIDAGDQAAALGVVVAAMTGRGELDARLLRTSGEGDLWQVRDVGGLTAQVSFRPAFADPDDPSHRLPNPRFSVSPTALQPGRPDALERLHTSILHEYRHVQQAAERANGPAVSGAGVEPGYGNDPDEFDAYLSEVESSYTRTHMTTAAVQAGVHWEFLADADRIPFRTRWTAAQARINRVLGYGVDAVLRTSMAERYRERLREMERLGREARERHGR